MKINDKKVKGEFFAFDNCHKFYILENEEEKQQALECGYSIYHIRILEEEYKKACELKFISNWSLNVQYVKQFENAIFTY